MMWWAVWSVALVAGGACTLAAPASNALAPLSSGDWAQVDPSGPDDDAYGYAMPPVGGRYASAPWLYLLTDLPHDSQRLGEARARPKRKMPSLSINNPMEVLRQRLLLEVARKQMREANQRQAVANRLFLQNVGKRGIWTHPVPARYDN
ncbi:diuretic hormone 45 isoform X1 [Epargyreus clarus]|uniref:diuretic hormone 45 isoform X1 n=1 Tax=Epargyreus clarus TaxID=520877 RepID=UPI003C2DF4DF